MGRSERRRARDEPGFLLQWDRCRYRYVEGEWGAPAAGLELEGEERRRVPALLLDRELRVKSRIGIDLEPVAVTSDEGALLLKSFVWADRRERLDRLDRAVALVRKNPPEIVRGDFLELLPDLLRTRRETPTIVLQVAAAGYLSAEGWERLHATLEAAGRDQPLAYVFAGKPGDGSHYYWGLWLTTWPDGSRTQLAHADFHGAWLDWLA